MELTYPVLAEEFFGNTVQAYLISLGIFAVSYGVLYVFRNYVVKKLRALAESTKGDIDDLVVEVVGALGWPLYFFISLSVSLQFVTLPHLLERIVFVFTFIIAAFYIGKALQRLIDYVFEKGMAARLAEGTKFDPSLIKMFGNFLKAVVWFILALLLLQNFGYDVTVLVAGLGIGGLAIAFAIQGILADVFASFSIYLDKPFETGDYIAVGDQRGTIKHIGIKTTRLQSSQGEELIIPNKDLTGARVQNYGRMEKRRISFTFGVTYETPTKKLKKIPEMVTEIVNTPELAEVDRVHFTDFGDFSLNFGVVFYFNSTDYAEFLDAQQEINFALKQRFEEEGIEFAYPTQTIFLKKT